MAVEEAVQKQQTKYVERSKTKPWSTRQFGKRTQAWQKMSEAAQKKEAPKGKK